jgi:hypothetical protein
MARPLRIYLPLGGQALWVAGRAFAGAYQPVMGQF